VQLRQISSAWILTETTSSSSKRCWSKELILTFSLLNIMVSSLRPFVLLSTMMQLTPGLVAITLGHHCSHSLIYSMRLGSGLSAAILRVRTHFSSQDAMQSYLPTCPRKRRNCTCRRITTGFCGVDILPTHVQSSAF